MIADKKFNGSQHASACPASVNFYANLLISRTYIFYVRLCSHFYMSILSAVSVSSVSQFLSALSLSISFRRVFIIWRL